MRRIVLEQFIDRFALKEVHTIRIPERFRFAQLRQIREQTPGRVAAICFEAGIERLDMQINFAASFCSLFFTEDDPRKNLPARFTASRVRETYGHIYVVSDFWDHIEFAKKFMAEIYV